MPARTDKERLEDVLDSILRIQVYCSGIDYDQFLRDSMRRDAVERQFIRLGEAASRVSPEFCQQNPEVPWDEMRGMRNWVVHIYWGVSAQILWQTAQSDLPRLEKQIRQLLADMGS